MRIFIAGASGLIGIRLIPLLAAEGHQIAGMTRSPERPPSWASVACCPWCAMGSMLAPSPVRWPRSRQRVIFHQLTDLPDNAAELAIYSDRNGRMRSEGTRNLLAAAAVAGGARVIAQSIAWELPSEHRRAVTAAHERAVLQADGVVIRYGQLWGPGTYYPAAPPEPPSIHVDDAARQTLPALDAPPGLTVVVDDRATGHHSSS